MEEVVEHVPPLNVLLSGAITMMLLTSSRSILPISHSSLLPLSSSPRPVSALIPRCPELGGLLGGEADSLRLDTEKLLPSRSLLGRYSSRRFPLRCGRRRLLLTP